MTIEQRAENIVDALTPEDGWWNSSTPDSLYGAVICLLAEGIEDNVAKDIVEMVVSAIRQEYGE